MPGILRFGISGSYIESSSSWRSRYQSAWYRSIVGPGQAGQDSVS